MSWVTLLFLTVSGCAHLLYTQEDIVQNVGCKLFLLGPSCLLRHQGQGQVQLGHRAGYQVFLETQRLATWRGHRERRADANVLLTEHLRLEQRAQLSSVFPTFTAQMYNNHASRSNNNGKWTFWKKRKAKLNNYVQIKMSTLMNLTVHLI